MLCCLLQKWLLIVKIAQLYLHLIDKGLGGTICCPLKSAGGSSYQIHLFPRLFLVVYVQISKDHGRFGGRYTLSEIHLSNVPAGLCRRSMWEYTLSTKTNPFCKMIVKKQKKPTFFSSRSIMTLKMSTSLTTTSSFLYRI